MNGAISLQYPDINSIPKNTAKIFTPPSQLKKKIHWFIPPFEQHRLLSVTLAPNKYTSNK